MASEDNIHTVSINVTGGESLTLSVKRGHLVFMVGPNGAGKSALISRFTESIPAKLLGLEFPPLLLARADEVIE